MTGYLAAAIAVLVAAIAVLWMLYKKERSDAKVLRERALANDKIIEQMQGIIRKYDEREKKISTGSDADRFDASIGVLSDIAKTGSVSGHS